MEFKCVCGEEINISVHINDFTREKIKLILDEFGWFCTISGGGTPKEDVWLCPSCLEKAKNTANELFKIVGNPYYNWSILIPKEIREKYHAIDK